MLPANPVPEKAEPAILDAWLNLSHREKAKELVMVRAIAIAIFPKTVSILFLRGPYSSPISRSHRS